jgi:enoyl-CoA hydratase
VINLERSGSAAVLTVDGGEGPNLLTIANLAELHRIVDALAGENSLRAVIIRGEDNGHFLAGADLRELSRLDGESSLQFARLGQSLFDKLERLDQPVIAAVDGYCLGGGLDLLLGCDLRFATPESQFAHPGARMGIITGFGGTYRLPREVGRARAMELSATCRRFPADEALRFGLINAIVIKHALYAYCLAKAERIAALPKRLVAEWKRGAASGRQLWGGGWTL